MAKRLLIDKDICETVIEILEKYQFDEDGNIRQDVTDVLVDMRFEAGYLKKG